MDGLSAGDRRSGQRDDEMAPDSKRVAPAGNLVGGIGWRKEIFFCLVSFIRIRLEEGKNDGSLAKTLLTPTLCLMNQLWPEGRSESKRAEWKSSLRGSRV